MSLSLTNRACAKQQTSDTLWFADLPFIFPPRSLNTPSLFAHQCLSARSQNTSRCIPQNLPPHPRRFLPYQMTLGLKASCQTWYESWPLLRDVFPPLAPCCAWGPSSVSENIFFLSWSYCHQPFCLWLENMNTLIYTNYTHAQRNGSVQNFNKNVL